MNLLRLVARPLLAAPFIVDGVCALRHPYDHVERAHDVLPAAQRVFPSFSPTDSELTTMTRVLGGVTTAAGLCFATGRAPRASAALLAVIAVPMAVTNNPVWMAKDREERTQILSSLVSRLGLVGGLAIASADRVGRPSAAWKVGNWRRQRALIADVRAAERARFAPLGAAE